MMETLPGMTIKMGWWRKESLPGMIRGWWEEASTRNDQRMVGRGLYLEFTVNDVALTGMTRWWEEVYTWSRCLLGKGLYLECPEDGMKRSLPGMTREWW
jgi:hypothetical protein